MRVISPTLLKIKNSQMRRSVNGILSNNRLISESLLWPDFSIEIFTLLRLVAVIFN